MTEPKSGSRALAIRCAQALEEKKLQDITIFDVSESIQITDFFVLASGLNSRHIRTASEFLVKRLREEGAGRPRIEGAREGKWILLDFIDVVVHFFLLENRSYYDLELLWGDCPRVHWEAVGRSAPALRESRELAEG